MSWRPEKAFILAAGEGRRLRPYTHHRPKPMVEIAGDTLIDRALDHLSAAGINQVVINLHYLGHILKQPLATRTDFDITLSEEDTLLDTGGGLKKMLGTFGQDPFFVTSGDALWTNGPQKSAIDRMVDMWDPLKMDALILLQPIETMTLTKGLGDYEIHEDGTVTRSLDKTGTHMWTSLRIIKPSLFDNTPDVPFSFLEVLDRAESEGRLYGLEHDADWHHISTPDDLERVDKVFTDNLPQKQKRS